MIKIIMSSKTYSYGHDLDLLIILHQLHVSYLTRCGCREKNYPSKARLPWVKYMLNYFLNPHDTPKMPFELTLPLWYWCMAGCIWNDKFVWHYSSSHGLEFTSCIRKETKYLWRNLCARWQAHPSQHWCVCSCSHLWSSGPWRSSPIFTSGSTHPLSQRESGWLGSLEHRSELQTLIPRTQWECWNC